MGHEFVELKNTNAAIEAYRRAVDINPRDYRAWYGLGQTYELLEMYFYALHYYRKATTLRPYDARMWCALAGCYYHLNRVQEAVKCYERAEVHHDREGIAAKQLAKIYEEDLHDEKQAAYYHKNAHEAPGRKRQGQHDWGTGGHRGASVHRQLYEERGKIRGRGGILHAAPRFCRSCEGGGEGDAEGDTVPEEP